MQSNRHEINGQAAVIVRSSRAQDNGRWIICHEIGESMIESDDLAARRGTYGTRKAALEAFRQTAEAAR